jgi:hypothetical protein
MISSRHPAAFLCPTKRRAGPETSTRNTFFKYLEVMITTETNSTLAEAVMRSKLVSTAAMMDMYERRQTRRAVGRAYLEPKASLDKMVVRRVAGALNNPAST